MTTFNYTGGAFSNLVGGTPGANVSNLVQLLNDLKTFLNGANLTDTNVTAAGLTDASLASPTSGVWRTVLTTYHPVSGLTTANYWASTNGLNPSGGAGSGTAQGLWVPPAAGDVAVAGKTTRLRLRVPFVVNATSAAITATWGLYPITASSGAAGTISLTFGTVVAGSTAAAALAGANGVATGASFDFSAVTPGGLYVIGVTGSGGQAANSMVGAQPILEMRHT